MRVEFNNIKLPVQQFGPEIKKDLENRINNFVNNYQDSSKMPILNDSDAFVGTPTRSGFVIQKKADYLDGKETGCYIGEVAIITDLDADLLAALLAYFPAVDSNNNNNVIKNKKFFSHIAI